MRLTVSFQIIDFCNMNCSGCNHFSPLASFGSMMSACEFKEIAERLSFLCGENIHICKIIIVGGEPLLHPELKQILAITKSVFCNASVDILTNGTLIKMLDKDTIDMIISTKAQFCCSDYHVGTDEIYNVSSRICDRKLFNYRYISDKKKDFSRLVCSVYHRRDGTALEDHPAHTNQINKNGDFFFCCIPANIHFYNNYFGTEILPEKGNDYFNIFESTQKDFMKNIVKSITCRKYAFCDYCRTPETGLWKRYEKGEDLWISQD